MLDENKNIIATDDTIKWATWLNSNNNRIVERTTSGRFTISTVFLGIDHSFRGDKPILFETMIFYIENENTHFLEYQQRYSTYDEAIEGHKYALSNLEEIIETDEKINQL